MALASSSLNQAHLHRVPGRYKIRRGGGARPLGPRRNGRPRLTPVGGSKNAYRRRSLQLASKRANFRRNSAFQLISS